VFHGDMILRCVAGGESHVKASLLLLREGVAVGLDSILATACHTHGGLYRPPSGLESETIGVHGPMNTVVVWGGISQKQFKERHNY